MCFKSKGRVCTKLKKKKKNYEFSLSFLIFIFSLTFLFILNMNNTSCTYRFIESSIADISERIHCNLIVRQQPERAKVSLVNERDRRPIEPPPILQLRWDHATEEELK